MYHQKPLIQFSFWFKRVPWIDNEIEKLNENNSPLFHCLIKLRIVRIAEDNGKFETESVRNPSDNIYLAFC